MAHTPLYVHMEAGPNPAAMKFVTSRALIPAGAHFEAKKNDPQAPLTEALFRQFEYIAKVFIMNNFVTLTRAGAVDWYEVGQDICNFLSDYLQSEKPILSDKAAKDSEVPPKDELWMRIQRTLDDYIRPAVERDGGAIRLHAFEDGIVKVHLQGACSGCPSATVTLKMGIENLLCRMIPEVKAVEAEPM